MIAIELIRKSTDLLSYCILANPGLQRSLNVVGPGGLSRSAEIKAIAIVFLLLVVAERFESFRAAGRKGARTDGSGAA